MLRSSSHGKYQISCKALLGIELKNRLNLPIFCLPLAHIYAELRVVAALRENTMIATAQRICCKFDHKVCCNLNSSEEVFREESARAVHFICTSV